MLCASFSDAQLTPTFYDTSCPTVTNIVRDTIVNELRSDPRIAGSILRLHFHDCFVNVRYHFSYIYSVMKLLYLISSSFKY